jgi:hypothetical protein
VEVRRGFLEKVMPELHLKEISKKQTGKWRKKSTPERENSFMVCDKH